MVKEQIIVNGVVYKLTFCYKIKEEARHKARISRSNGHLVRIIKTKIGWCVYDDDGKTKPKKEEWDRDAGIAKSEKVQRIMRR